MSSFNDAIERMKSLYTYGNVNEDKQYSTHTIEYHQMAADGKSYGIIRECNKYYIKTAPENKALVAEAYNYIGGICNKKDYEYTNYNSALKNFELKIASINEAVAGNVKMEELEAFKTKSPILEGSDIMQREIARQRQIMHNAAMIMNESIEIGADRKNDVVMYDKENPEAPKGGNTVPSNKQTKADPEYKGSNTKGLDKDVTPFDKKVTVKEECECNCSEKDDWGSEGMCKGRDPKQIGWDIDGQEMVNEEENDWASEGLPGTPGVGEADTDHNNNPFNKNINEGDEDFDDVEDVESDDVESDDVEPDGDETPIEGDDDIDLGIEGDESDEDGDDFVEDDDIDNTENGEEETDEPVLDDEEPIFDDEEEEPSDNEFNDETEDEPVEGEEEWEDFNVDDENDELSDLGDDEFDNNEIEGEAEGEPEDSFDDEDFSQEDEYPDEDPTRWEGDDYEHEDGVVDECGMEECGDLEECGDMDLYESKNAIMKRIVDSVVTEVLNEDTLHVFGKHPGYRKKPMQLPATGSDKNEWGEDWNDDSVHSEEPFGSKIGDGKPFDKLVDAVTAVVMEQLKGGKKKMK